MYPNTPVEPVFNGRHCSLNRTWLLHAVPAVPVWVLIGRAQRVRIEHPYGRTLGARLKESLPAHNSQSSFSDSNEISIGPSLQKSAHGLLPNWIGSRFPLHHFAYFLPPLLLKPTLAFSFVV